MKQEGFSLVIVVLLIAMLSSLAIVATKIGGLRVASMYGAVREKQAYYMADAAFQHALFKLNQDSTWRGDINDKPFAGGTYSLNVSQTSSNDDITITATGSAGGTERTIVRTIPPPDKPFIIIAFAGTGTQGWSGNNGPALNARLNRPRGVHRNAAGDVYIADRSNHQIRYINAVSDNIHAMAGVGTVSGYNCNNCNPLTARLNAPEGVFIDSTGNVYIADTRNHIIRKVVAGGNIINVAGTPGTQGSSGDGGLAANARLRSPKDAVSDSNGNIYIADTGNCRIRKVNAATSVITNFAGTGTCGYNGDGAAATSRRLNSPAQIVFDSNENLYVADTGNNRIRRIDKITGIITTVAGGGAGGDGGMAVNAQLNAPEGITINSFDTMYIADSGNNRIRRVDGATGIITAHAGTGTQGNTGDGGLAINARLNRPRRVTAFDDVDGHLIIADTNNNRIREVSNAY
ncbi:MAG: hypothetical protein IT393_02540 [Nitrospirae bacterium]|nr:hypothetical protein [Nitrospirota bacterium]